MRPSHVEGHNAWQRHESRYALPARPVTPPTGGSPRLPPPPPPRVASSRRDHRLRSSGHAASPGASSSGSPRDGDGGPRLHPGLSHQQHHTPPTPTSSSQRRRLSPPRGASPLLEKLSDEVARFQDVRDRKKLRLDPAAAPSSPGTRARNFVGQVTEVVRQLNQLQRAMEDGVSVVYNTSPNKEHLKRFEASPQCYPDADASIEMQLDCSVLLLTESINHLLKQYEESQQSVVEVHAEQLRETIAQLHAVAAVVDTGLEMTTAAYGPGATPESEQMKQEQQQQQEDEQQQSSSPGRLSSKLDGEIHAVSSSVRRLVADVKYLTEYIEETRKPGQKDEVGELQRVMSLTEEEMKKQKHTKHSNHNDNKDDDGAAKNSDADDDESSPVERNLRVMGGAVESMSRAHFDLHDTAESSRSTLFEQAQALRKKQEEQLRRLNELEEENKTLRADLDSSNRRYSEQQQQTTANDEALTRDTLELEHTASLRQLMLRAADATADVKLRALEDEKEALEKKLQSSRAEQSSDLQRRVKALEDEHSAALEDVERKLGETSRNVQHWKRECERAKAEAEQQASEARDTETELRARLRSAESSASSLKQQKRELEDEHAAALEEAARELAQVQRDLRESKSDKARTASELNIKIADLEQQVADAADRTEQQVKRAQRREETLGEQVQQLQRDLDEAQSSARQHEADAQKNKAAADEAKRFSESQQQFLKRDAEAAVEQQKSERAAASKREEQLTAELAKAREEIAQLGSKLQAAEQETERERAQSKSALADVADLKEQLHREQHAVAELQKELDSAKDITGEETSRADEQIVELTQQLHDEQNKRTAAEKQLDEEKQQREQQQSSEVKDLRDRVAELEQQQKDNESKLSAATADCTRLDTELTDALRAHTADKTAAAERDDQHREQMALLQQELDESKKQLAEAREEVAAAHEQRARQLDEGNKKQQAAQEQELEQLKEELAKTGSEQQSALAAASAEAAELKKQLEAAQKDAEQRQSETAELQKQLDAEKSQAESEREQHAAALAAAEQARETDKRRADDATAERDDLSKQLQQSAADSNELRSERDSASERAAAAQKTVADLEAKLATAEQDASAARSALAEHRQRTDGSADEQAEQHAKLLDEMLRHKMESQDKEDALRRELVDAQQELDSARDASRRSEERVAALQKDLADERAKAVEEQEKAVADARESEQRRAEQQQRQQQEQLSEGVAKSAQLEQQLADKQRELDDKAKELADADSRRAVAEADKNAAQRDIEQLRAAAVVDKQEHEQEKAELQQQLEHAEEEKREMSDILSKEREVFLESQRLADKNKELLQDLERMQADLNRALADNTTLEERLQHQHQQQQQQEEHAKEQPTAATAAADTNGDEDARRARAAALQRQRRRLEADKAALRGVYLSEAFSRRESEHRAQIVDEQQRERSDSLLDEFSRLRQQQLQETLENTRLRMTAEREQQNRRELDELMKQQEQKQRDREMDLQKQLEEAKQQRQQQQQRSRADDRSQRQLTRANADRAALRNMYLEEQLFLSETKQRRRIEQELQESLFSTFITPQQQKLQQQALQVVDQRNKRTAEKTAEALLLTESEARRAIVEEAVSTAPLLFAATLSPAQSTTSNSDAAIIDAARSDSAVLSRLVVTQTVKYGEALRRRHVAEEAAAEFRDIVSRHLSAVAAGTNNRNRSAAPDDDLVRDFDTTRQLFLEEGLLRREAERRSAIMQDESLDVLPIAASIPRSSSSSTTTRPSNNNNNSSRSAAAARRVAAARRDAVALRLGFLFENLNRRESNARHSRLHEEATVFAADFLAQKPRPQQQSRGVEISPKQLEAAEKSASIYRNEFLAESLLRREASARSSLALAEAAERVQMLSSFFFAQQQQQNKATSNNNNEESNILRNLYLEASVAKLELEARRTIQWQRNSSFIDDVLLPALAKLQPQQQQQQKSKKPRNTSDRPRAVDDLSTLREEFLEQIFWRREAAGRHTVAEQRSDELLALVREREKSATKLQATALTQQTRESSALRNELTESAILAREHSERSATELEEASARMELLRQFVSTLPRDKQQQSEEPLLDSTRSAIASTLVSSVLDVATPKAAREETKERQREQKRQRDNANLQAMRSNFLEQNLLRSELLSRSSAIEQEAAERMSLMHAAAEARSKKQQQQHQQQSAPAVTTSSSSSSSQALRRRLSAEKSNGQALRIAYLQEALFRQESSRRLALLGDAADSFSQIVQAAMAANTSKLQPMPSSDKNNNNKKQLSALQAQLVSAGENSGAMRAAFLEEALFHRESNRRTAVMAEASECFADIVSSERRATTAPVVSSAPADVAAADAAILRDHVVTDTLARRELDERRLLALAERNDLCGVVALFTKQMLSGSRKARRASTEKQQQQQRSSSAADAAAADKRVLQHMYLQTALFRREQQARAAIALDASNALQREAFALVNNKPRSSETTKKELVQQQQTRQPSARTQRQLTRANADRAALRGMYLEEQLFLSETKQRRRIEQELQESLFSTFIAPQQQKLGQQATQVVDQRNKRTAEKTALRDMLVKQSLEQQEENSRAAIEIHALDALGHHIDVFAKQLPRLAQSDANRKIKQQQLAALEQRGKDMQLFYMDRSALSKMYVLEVQIRREAEARARIVQEAGVERFALSVGFGESKSDLVAAESAANADNRVAQQQWLGLEAESRRRMQLAENSTWQELAVNFVTSANLELAPHVVDWVVAESDNSSDAASDETIDATPTGAVAGGPPPRSPARGLQAVIFREAMRRQELERRLALLEEGGGGARHGSATPSVVSQMAVDWQQ